MVDSNPFAEGDREDEALIASTSERLRDELQLDPQAVEDTVRDELGQWRARARVQTFVPIMAERGARDRLRKSR